jgi:hypothetical protein
MNRQGRKHPVKYLYFTVRLYQNNRGKAEYTCLFYFRGILKLENRYCYCPNFQIHSYNILPFLRYFPLLD